MNCESCRHWVPTEQRQGGCHLYPPVPVYAEKQQTFYTVWPVTQAMDYCSMWDVKLDFMGRQ